MVEEAGLAEVKTGDGSYRRLAGRQAGWKAGRLAGLQAARRKSQQEPGQTLWLPGASGGRWHKSDISLICFANKRY